MDSDLNLEILKEEIALEKRLNVTGLVRLEKKVRTAQEIVEETLTSESFSVERVPLNRLVNEPPPTRQEGDTTVIPVMEERVVVTKQLYVKEEIRITRQRQENRYREAVPVRTEEVEVTRIDPKDDERSKRRSTL